MRILERMNNELRELEEKIDHYEFIAGYNNQIMQLRENRLRELREDRIQLRNEINLAVNNENNIDNQDNPNQEQHRPRNREPNDPENEVYVEDGHEEDQREEEFPQLGQ
jgi:hypothetical protein